MSKLRIEHGKVYIDDMEPRWPILEVRSNDDEPYFKNHYFPYRGLTVGCENGWLINVTLRTTDDEPEAGTSEYPQVTVTPIGCWANMINNLDIRAWMKIHGDWEQFIITPKPFMKTEEIADYIKVVATWPSPPQQLMALCLADKNHPLHRPVI